MNVTTSDSEFFERALRLALEAEKANNLPIGAVISLEGRAIADGKNAIWHPQFDPTRHAEIEADDSLYDSRAMPNVYGRNPLTQYRSYPVRISRSFRRGEQSYWPYANLFRRGDIKNRMVGTCIRSEVRPVI